MSRDSSVSFVHFLGLMRREWKLFAVVGGITIALASVLSGPSFIPPRYRSTATVYPVNLTSYSTETRTDQLLQLLNSNSIRDSLIKRFDLATVYKVDTTRAGGYYALYNEFSDRVDISKTRYESVMIEIVDEDPVRARDMVNAMLDQTDLLARRLQREKSSEVLHIAQRAMEHERHKLDSVEARLAELRQNSGLLSYDQQARELTKGYVKLLSQPGVSQAQKDQVLRLMKELEEKGGEFRHLTDMSNMFRQNLDRLITEYERVVNDVTKELTYTNVVIYPEVSDKKVYPVRWLIVAIAFASSMALCFVLMVLRDGMRVKD
jgi:capsule polysaccharide export protein KpsE/RkpR